MEQMTVLPDPRITALVTAQATELVERLKQAQLIGHPGESGRARETALSRYLQAIVPGDFGISTGFVLDAHGAISQQIDLVIYRRGHHPIFEVSGVNHFLVESVAAVIQSKAAIDSQDDLRRALDNLAPLRNLIERTVAITTS